MTRHPELPERDRRILAAVVQAYIEQGEPISSLWLAGRGLRGVVRDAAQRHGPARRTGLRPPAAHLCRPRPDRSRVSQLRRPAAGGAADARGRRRRSRNGCAGPARSRTCCRTRPRRSRARRIRSASRSPARRSTRRSSIWTSCRSTAARVLVVLVVGRRPHLAQGHRAGEQYEPDELQQAANYLNTEFKGMFAAARSGRRCSSGCARSARCTIG